MRKIVLLLWITSIVLLCGCGQATASGQNNNSVSSSDQSTNSTGFQSGMVQSSMVYVNGALYVHEVAEPLTTLPQNAALIGSVKTNDPWTVPSEELHSAHVDAGIEIYGCEDDPIHIYVYYVQTSEYRSMIRSDQVENWWS